MNLLNILSQIIAENVAVYDTGLANLEPSFVTNAVTSVIEFFASAFGGYIAVGILVFTLLLKIIPLPLDIYSRVASKKNAIKMEKMRPELERLQKQYANNKELYNQKMMALQKKEGYSPFAACLPSLFTIVFFLVVITAFNQYSTYTKVETFNQMATAFSESVKTNENVDAYYLNVNADGSLNYSEGEKIVGSVEEYLSAQTNGDINRVKYFLKDGLTTESAEYKTLVLEPAQKAAALKYIELSKSSEFLWVKNIWIEDLPWGKAFVTREDYVNTTFTYSKGCGSDKITSSISSGEVYDILTGSPLLDEYKNQPNGYLILVVLSILSMLGSQLIMNKTQKTQMELQSVDGANGQAAQTTKMMTWMMPIMFGVFAFVYTASFSIYLIVSTLFSTISTLLINLFVEKKIEKKFKEEQEAEYQKRYGYILKTKQKQTEQKNDGEKVKGE